MMYVCKFFANETTIPVCDFVAVAFILCLWSPPHIVDKQQRLRPDYAFHRLCECFLFIYALSTLLCLLQVM